MRPTQRAADFWESAASRSSFLASSFFYTSNRISARQKSANASRWAASLTVAPFGETCAINHFTKGYLHVQLR